MDFLDPRRRKAHRRRLLLGYVLMAVLVSISTVAILYMAYGWDIDRKTGHLIQNGIVFVDSKPQGAKIFLNDKEHRSRTDSRMVLPSGVYTVRLELDGYRTWERTFNLEGGQIQRLVYPFLIPNRLDTTDIDQFEIMPSLATQSPDRRWVLVQVPGQTYQFRMYDLNDTAKVPVDIVVPASILTEPSAEGTSLKFVEWSNDNRHLVFERSFDDRTEFIVLDRERPAESKNINTTFGIEPTSVSLKNKRHDQFYYLEQVPGVLRFADMGNNTISAPLAINVSDYASYGDDIIVYATELANAAKQAEVRILENGKNYILRSINAAPRYLLDVARYDGQWFYAAGGSNDRTVAVYQNPLDVLRRETGRSPVLKALIRLDNPQFVSFSANTQFISVQSGNKFTTLDLEHSNQYRVELEHNIPADYKMRWMDGHRLIFSASEQSHIVDFDGSNENTLVTSRLNPGPFFDRDYNNVFTFEESKANGAKKALTMTVIDD